MLKEKEVGGRREEKERRKDLGGGEEDPRGGKETTRALGRKCGTAQGQGRGEEAAKDR